MRFFYEVYVQGGFFYCVYSYEVSLRYFMKYFRSTFFYRMLGRFSNYFFILKDKVRGVVPKVYGSYSLSFATRIEGRDRVSLIVSRRANFLMVDSGSPRRGTSVFSVVSLQIRLLVFIYSLVSQYLIVVRRVFRRLGNFFIFDLYPIGVVSARRVCGLYGLVMYVNFFPKSTMSVSSIAEDYFRVFRRIFFYVSLYGSSFVRSFLVCPRDRMSNVSQGASGIAIFVYSRVLRVALYGLAASVFYRGYIIRAFRPT